MTGTRVDFGPNFRTPFGKNEWLGSTGDIGHESWTVAASTVPVETIDSATDQKVLQPGTIMCEITSGPEIGKVGPLDSGATDGRQTVANIRGINNTFLPWQLMQRDTDIDVVIDAWGNKAAIFGYLAGVKTALPALVVGSACALTDFQTPVLDIRFRKPSADVLGVDFGQWPLS